MQSVLIMQCFICKVPHRCRYGDGGGENSTRVYPETGWFMEPPLYCRVFLDGPVNDPSTPNRYWLGSPLPICKKLTNTLPTPFSGLSHN